MIFVALTGAAVMLQAIVLFALYLTMRKTAQTLQTQLDDLKTTVVPVVNESREFLARVGPKVESAASDVAEMTRSLHAQSAELQKTATELLERVRKQSARIDAIFSKVLDGVDHAGSVVATAVSKPVRQLQAVMASARAVISVFKAAAPRAKPVETHAAADQDMFV